MLPRVIVMLPSVSLEVVIPVPPAILIDSPLLTNCIEESSAPMLKLYCDPDPTHSLPL